jgi:hypothetical protein
MRVGINGMGRVAQLAEQLANLEAGRRRARERASPEIPRRGSLVRSTSLLRTRVEGEA